MDRSIHHFIIRSFTICFLSLNSDGDGSPGRTITVTIQGQEANGE